jgi:hypothetical protein
MAQDSELLTKMDALLKKHQRGARYSDQASEAKDAEDIPTLTEMVFEQAPEEYLERDLIPVLTAVVEEKKPAEIELDFDFDVDFPSAFDEASVPTPSEYELAPSSAKAATVAKIPEVSPVAVESAPSPEAFMPTEITSQDKDNEGAKQPKETPPPILGDNPCIPEQHLQISDSVAEQLLSGLQLQIPGMLERTIMPQLSAALSREISSLIDQFTLHIELVVRDAIAHELKKQLPEIQAQLANPDKPSTDPV